MNRILFSASLLLFSHFALAQTTYICMIYGKPAYTTVKQDASCKPSTINGISEQHKTAFAPPVAVASAVALPTETVNPADNVETDDNDAIAKIWNDYEYGSYDRTPILPPPPPQIAKPVETNELNNKNKNNTVTRKISVPTRPVATVQYQAPTVPVLSRKQVLSKEIEHEQTALKLAETQLAAAKKRNDTVNIQRLSNVVNDRRQNMQSLQRELQR